jgi:general secretion pathway protein I
MNNRAFTLLEVMVAVAILGLSLTVILSAQAGLYAATTHAKNETVAIGMARCKMGEIEEELLRLGYQETDVVEEGECCEDNTPTRVRCKWKIDRVELPDPPTFDEMNPAGDGGTLDLATPSDPSSMMPGGTGALGVLASLGSGDGSALKNAGPEGGMGALSSMLGDASGGVAGLAPMVMSIVYPSLKPMLEASIRKITVTVLWKEGINERELSVVQYVTNPMRGGLGMSMEGMDPEAAGGLGITPGGAFGASDSPVSTSKVPLVPPMPTGRGR